MVRLAGLPFFIFVIILPLVLSACGDKKSPEDQIRQFVTAAVNAAESREALVIRQLVSEQYMDTSIP